MIKGGIGEGEGAATENNCFGRDWKRKCRRNRVCYVGRKRAGLDMIKSYGAVA